MFPIGYINIQYWVWWQTVWEILKASPLPPLRDNKVVKRQPKLFSGGQIRIRIRNRHTLLRVRRCSWIWDWPWGGSDDTRWSSRRRPLQRGLCDGWGLWSWYNITVTRVPIPILILNCHYSRLKRKRLGLNPCHGIIYKLIRRNTCHADRDTHTIFH